jgi:hypothetical protein
VLEKFVVNGINFNCVVKMLITNLKSAINHTWICEQSMYFSIARREITSLQRCLCTFKTLWWRCRPEDTQCWQINILQSIQYLFNSFLRNGWVEHDSKKFSFRKASNHIGFSTLLWVTSWSYKLDQDNFGSVKFILKITENWK